MITGTQGQDQQIVPQKKRLSATWVVVVVFALVASYFVAPVLATWSAAIPYVDKKELIIAPVIRGDLVRDVAVNGKVVAANAPQLYSTEEGQITLMALPGEAVKKNQVVAQVSSPELEALIKQQRSVLEQLVIDGQRGDLADKEAQLDLESKRNSALSLLNVAKREKERAEISYKKQIVSEVDWLKSLDRLEDATRQFSHIEKRMKLAKERFIFESQNRQLATQRQQLVLDELVRRKTALHITAPVDGVVGNWLVEQKNKVAANTAVMSIVDLSAYDAELYVPEFYADDLGIGLVVMMKIGNKQITGKVIAVSPEIKSNQVQVRVNIDSTDSLQLRQNQRLNARIEFEKKLDVLMVKKGTFLGSLGGKQAFRIKDENSAEQVAITIGSQSVEYIELLAGVSEGEQLIISDYEKYQQANEIRIE